MVLTSREPRRPERANRTCLVSCQVTNVGTESDAGTGRQGTATSHSGGYGEEAQRSRSGYGAARMPRLSRDRALVFPVMLFAALLLIPQVSVFASSYAPATLQDDPETIRFQEEELAYIRQDLDVLADSLDTALQSIALGSELIDDIRKELRRIGEDLKELGDVPGALPLRTTLMELRRLSMEAYLGRAMVDLPISWR